MIQLTRGKKGARKKRIQVFLHKKQVEKIDEIIDEAYYIESRSECIREVLRKKLDEYRKELGGPAGIGRG